MNDIGQTQKSSPLARSSSSVQAASPLRWHLPLGLVAAASLALIVGLAVYIADRSVGTSVRIPGIRAGLQGGASLFGSWGQWLPSFTHAFAFSLFTAAALPLALRYGLAACAAWGATDIALELAQHSLLHGQTMCLFEYSQDSSWIVTKFVHYACRGTFDMNDVFAVAVGALVAAAIIYCLYRRTEHSDVKTS